MLMPDQVTELMKLDKDSVMHAKKQREYQDDMEMRMATHLNEDTSKISTIEAQSYLLEYDSTFDDFNEVSQHLLIPTRSFT